MACVTDCVLSAIEVFHLSAAEGGIKVLDTVAENLSSSAVALGARPTALPDLAPALNDAVLAKNGEVSKTGCSRRVAGRDRLQVRRASPGRRPHPVPRPRPHGAGPPQHLTAELSGLGTVIATFTSSGE